VTLLFDKEILGHYDDIARRSFSNLLNQFKLYIFCLN
jgi:hypothetical protein